MEKPKFHLNPNEEIVKTIREGLKRTGGYAPGRLQHIPENIAFARSSRSSWPTRTATGRAIAGCM